MGDYTDELLEHLQNPEALERIYRQALQRGEEKRFREALENLFAQYPQNLLLAAWHYRLTEEVAFPRPMAGRLSRRWLWAVVFALLNGLAFWWLSDFSAPARMARQHIPFLLLYWAPIAAICVLLFLFSGWQPVSPAAAGPAGGPGPGQRLCLLRRLPHPASVLLATVPDPGAIHLIPLAWASVALYVLKGQADEKSRIAFLAKSLEAVVLGGLSGSRPGHLYGGNPRPVLHVEPALHVH